MLHRTPQPINRRANFWSGPQQYERHLELFLMENSFKCPLRMLVLESFLDIKQNALVIFSNPNSQCNGQSTENSGCGEQSFPPPTAAVFSFHDGKFSRNHSFGKSVIILFVYSRMSLVFLSGQSTHANSMVSYVSSQYMCVFCSTSNMSHIKKKHHKTPHSNVCVSIFVQILVLNEISIAR